MSQSQPQQSPVFDPQLDNPKVKNLLTLTLTKQSSNTSNKKLKPEPENSQFANNNPTQQRNSSNNASLRQNDAEEQDISYPDSDRVRVSRERVSPGAKNLFVIKQSTHHLEHQRSFFNQNLDDSWNSYQNRSITPKRDHKNKQNHPKHRQAGYVKPKKALLAKREEINIVAARAKRYTDSNECESLQVSRSNFDDFTAQSIDTVGRGNYASYRRKSCECTECGGVSKFEKIMQNYPGVPALIPHERNMRKILIADEKSPNNKNAKKRFEAAKTKMKIINKGLTPMKGPPLQTIQSNPGTMGTTPGTQDMTTPKGATTKILQKLSSLGGFSRRSSVAKSTKSIVDFEQKDLLETVQQEPSSTKGRMSTERGLTKIISDHNSLHNIQEVLGLEKILSTYEQSPTAAGAHKDERKMLLTPRKHQFHEEYTGERSEKRNDSIKNIMSNSREMKRTLSRLQTSGPSTSRNREEKVENFKQIEHKILRAPKLKLKKITKPQVAANKNTTIKKVYCNPGDFTISGKDSVQDNSPRSPKFHVAPNFFRLISRNQASVPTNKTTGGPNMQSRFSVGQSIQRDLPSPSMEYYNMRTEEDAKVQKVQKRVKIKPIKNLEIAVLPYLGGVGTGVKSPVTAKTPKNNKTFVLESPRIVKTSRDARLVKNYQSLKKK